MKPTIQPTTQTTTPSKRGRPATGRKRNKLLQIRLSDQEQEKLFETTALLNTNPTELLRELLEQLSNKPLPEESVMIKVKGHLLYLSKQEAKKLLIDLTSQI